MAQLGPKHVEKIVNVKRKNKSVSSWKRNKVFINDARSTKHKDTLTQSNATQIF